MRKKVPPIVESGRVTSGLMGLFGGDGITGAFRIVHPDSKEILAIIASDGFGWEHVSVSLPHRCPTWEEMDFVKRLFWNDSEVVCQYHINDAEKVNLHPFCLHLWKPKKTSRVPVPPSILVGPKGESK